MASHSPPLDALVVPSEDYHQVRLLITRSRFFLLFLILSSNMMFFVF